VTSLEGKGSAFIEFHFLNSFFVSLESLKKNTLQSGKEKVFGLGKKNVINYNSMIKTERILFYYVINLWIINKRTGNLDNAGQGSTLILVVFRSQLLKGAILKSS
jgi:hypothetical protein